MDWPAQINTALQSFWVPRYKVTDLSKAEWQHHRKLVMLYSEYPYDPRKWTRLHK